MLRFCSFVLISLILAGPSIAAPRLRVATIFTERMDGTARATSMTEQEVARALLKANLRLIDEAQSRRIRSLTSTKELLQGRISPVISTRDADLILAAAVEIKQVDARIAKKKALKYQARITAKLIAVDNGEVVGAYNLLGDAMHFTKESTAGQAAKKAAQRLVKRLLADLPEVPKELELTLFGQLSMQKGQAIKSGIATFDGVGAVRVVHSDAKQRELVVTSSGITAEALALALDQHSALGLRVLGYSRRAVHAVHDPARALALTLFVTPLKLARLGKTESWKSAAYAEILGTSLSSCSFLEVAPINTKVKKGLVLTGRLLRQGRNTNVEVRLSLAGKRVTSGQRSCPRAEEATCVAQLGETLARTLLERLQKHQRRLGTRLSSAVFAPLPAVKPLVIDSITIEDVFPAQINAYARRALGSIHLHNPTEQPITNLVLSSSLDGFSASPVDVSLATLAPKEKKSLPVKLLLDQKILEQKRNQPAVLRLHLSYRQQELRYTDQRRRAVVVHPRNAISWQTPASVASFVRARNPALIEGARASLQTIPKRTARDGALEEAAALFGMLHTIRYVRDPATPFGSAAVDAIQSPLETLKAGGGDCDDLAVLYASLLLAVGRPAALIVTPQHVLAAVALDVPPRNIASSLLDPSEVIVHRGRVFLPVETTYVGRGFLNAWRTGPRGLLRKSSYEVIDLQEAWQQYPPAELPETMAPIISRLEGVRSAVQELRSHRKKVFEKALEQVNRRLAKSPKSPDLNHRKARLLAWRGDTVGARSVLETIPSSNRSEVTLNDLGNLELMERDPKAALTLYRASLAKRSVAAVHINAALAAWQIGSNEQMEKHIMACLELGAHDLVDEVARMGLQPESRGALQGGSSGFVDAVRRVYPRASAPSATRGSKVDGGTIAHLLHWL